jgi:hypothetical protein
MLSQFPDIVLHRFDLGGDIFFNIDPHGWAEGGRWMRRAVLCFREGLIGKYSLKGRVAEGLHEGEAGVEGDAVVRVNVTRSRNVERRCTCFLGHPSKGFHDLHQRYGVEPGRGETESMGGGEPEVLSDVSDLVVPKANLTFREPLFLRHFSHEHPVDFRSFCNVSEESSTTPQGLVIWVRCHDKHNFARIQEGPPSFFREERS